MALSDYFSRFNVNNFWFDKKIFLNLLSRYLHLMLFDLVKLENSFLRKKKVSQR